MKTYLTILLSLILISCETNDIPNTQAFDDFKAEVHGLYRLKSVIIDRPLDINNDGIAQTNLLEESTFCNMALLYNSYTCTFTWNPSYQDIKISVPVSRYSRPNEPQSSCIQDRSLFYDFDYDAENNTAVVVPSDYWEDFAAQHQTELIEMRWQPGSVNFIFNKEFYDSQGVWQEVTLYMEFEKTDERI